MSTFNAFAQAQFAPDTAAILIIAADTEPLEFDLIDIQHSSSLVGLQAHPPYDAIVGVDWLLLLLGQADLDPFEFSSRLTQPKSRLILSQVFFDRATVTSNMLTNTRHPFASVETLRQHAAQLGWELLHDEQAQTGSGALATSDDLPLNPADSWARHWLVFRR
ncbi:MAG: hypothetical protein GYB68_17275 [Chloroflexi bacterium]|nr:hypothetical protein [Chloroflexota bacterium]